MKDSSRPNVDPDLDLLLEEAITEYRRRRAERRAVERERDAIDESAWLEALEARLAAEAEAEIRARTRRLEHPPEPLPPLGPIAGAAPPMAGDLRPEADERRWADLAVAARGLAVRAAMAEADIERYFPAHPELPAEPADGAQM